MTIVRAMGKPKLMPKKLICTARWPKKLIGPSAAPICWSIAFTAPENGSNSTTHEKATAITGAT